MEPINWTEETVDINELEPNPDNPRTIDAETWKHLEESLQKFNLASPLIVNNDYSIIGGHQRYKILKDQGVDEVDVRKPDRQLDEEEVEELMIRLNANLADWDNESLKNFEEEFLSEIGMEDSLIDSLFEEEEEVEENEEEHEIEEMKIKNFEHYDYLVFVFRNDNDFLTALDMFDVEKVRSREKHGL